MHAVTGNSPYYGNGYGNVATPSTGQPSTQLTPPQTGAPDYWSANPPGAYRPSTQLTPPSPDAPDYWNSYPQSSGCQPCPAQPQPVTDFNSWLQNKAPKLWDANKSYKPGDQVIHNGSVYQAPNQGGRHTGVRPNTDDAKWLYHGTVVNNYNYYLRSRPANG